MPWDKAAEPRRAVYGRASDDVLAYATPARRSPRDRIIWWVHFVAVVILYITVLGGLLLFIVGPIWRA
jgi:hypothetical protein